MPSGVGGPPRAAERVQHGGERGAEVAPARLAAQADAGHVVGVDLRGRSRRPRPRSGCAGIVDAGASSARPCGTSGTTTRRRTATRRACRRPTSPSRTVGIRSSSLYASSASAYGVRSSEPAVGAELRRLVHADHHDVELLAAGADVAGGDLAQGALVEDRVVHLDAGLGGEQRRASGRDVLHLRVADDGDVDLAALAGRRPPGPPGCGAVDRRRHRRPPRPAHGDDGRMRAVRRLWRRQVDARSLSSVSPLATAGSARMLPAMPAL